MLYKSRYHCPRYRAGETEARRSGLLKIIQDGCGRARDGTQASTLSRRSLSTQPCCLSSVCCTFPFPISRAKLGPINAAIHYLYDRKGSSPATCSGCHPYPSSRPTKQHELFIHGTQQYRPEAVIRILHWQKQGTQTLPRLYINSFLPGESIYCKEVPSSSGNPGICPQGKGSDQLGRNPPGSLRIWFCSCLPGGSTWLTPNSGNSSEQLVSAKCLPFAHVL